MSQYCFFHPTTLAKQHALNTECQWSKCGHKKVGFCSLRVWHDRPPSPSRKQPVLSSDTMPHDTAPMLTLFCKHRLTSVWAKQTLWFKLVTPCLDLVWHKYKVTTLRAFSEERPEVAWKGKVSCSHWYAAREEKRDSWVFLLWWD